MIKQYIQRMQCAILFTAIIFAVFPVQATADQYLMVRKDKVNIRATPNTNAEILWEVFKGFPLKVISKKNQWSEVIDFEGDKGWIHSSLLANEKRVIVKSTTVNMRSGPGLNYGIVATVKYGVILRPIATQKDWVKVKHEGGTTGWVNQPLIWPSKF